MPYPLALALTLLVEVPLYVAALVPVGRVRPVRATVAAVAVNALTHPPLWWFLGHFAAGAAAAYWTAFGLAELAVCVVEAVLLRALLGARGPLPYAASLTANAGSLLAGLLLGRMLLGG
ncbi:hypothetical protein [Kitasatospora sp. NPDC050543]|uniref:hypothetical protein n=1 Tax=Kitasatospora sp. NPDC050543 TaxID=3364054 RepID=UPI003789EC57